MKIQLIRTILQCIDNIFNSFGAEKFEKEIVMRYVLKWEYEGEYEEYFYSDLCDCLIDTVRDFWDRSGFDGLATARLYDENNNLIFEL